MGFPEKAGKQKTECLGWGVGTIIKPTMPSNPVCLGICLVSMQTTLLQTPTKTQVCLDTIKMEILQEYSQVNVQPQASNSLLDFVIGFPGVQYPLHQAALLEQLGEKGEYSGFSRELWILLLLPWLPLRSSKLSSSPAQLLPGYCPQDPSRAAAPAASPGWIPAPAAGIKALLHFPATTLRPGHSQLEWSWSVFCPKFVVIFTLKNGIWIINGVNFNKYGVIKWGEF